MQTKVLSLTATFIRTMKDLIILMDDPKERFCTPSKMGNTFLNRFTIDEDARFEVLGIHYMAKLGDKTSNENLTKNSRVLESDLIEKGTGILSD